MGSEQRAISNRLKLPSFAKEKQIKTTTTEHIEKMQIGGGDRGTLENKLQTLRACFPTGFLHASKRNNT
jgi:D-serine deaminase-like pyridoxal phosphate-dependent protein